MSSSISRPRSGLGALALALAICSLPLCAANNPSAVSTDRLQTQSEQSGFVRTGRYAEVGELCERFARRYPQWVRCTSIGITPEGRKMHLLVVSTSGKLTARAAQAAQLPVVLAQGGIHAGEIDGKDAGFWWLRDVLEDSGRCSMSMAMNALAHGTDPTSAARNRWAGAPPRKMST